MPFFSNIFKGKDGHSKKHAKQNGIVEAPTKPRWEDAWQRKEVDPEEVQELLRCCTYEIKSRALAMPFLLLPFRPASDPSAARTFIRNYFSPTIDKGGPLEGENLKQELRLTEPLVLVSVMKWCWSRLAGGIVTWEAYELFKIGEQDSNTARDAFATFIPISVASDARTKIIFDFFDLMAAIAAHGKTNGMGGLKLSRLGGWYAFEHVDTGNGFDGGYKAWEAAANATSHLFFAYLRSLTPDSVHGTNGISALPLSLQNLLETTEYPPILTGVLQSQTTKVVMIVDTVSPTPFALLRRAKHFQYRDSDQALQRFSEYDDPVQALTDECRRVLKNISSANDSSTTKASTSLRDPSWSRFEDIGFGGLGDESDHDDEADGSALGRKRRQPQGLRTTPHSRNDLGRPTTPSWADFLSSGFVDDPSKNTSGLLLPPDKVLPPINTRGQSSQSHKPMTDRDSMLEPGELASITSFNLDDAFWWVWISSLAGEEPIDRKAAFGRCALIETNIRGGKWLVMEEIIKGAAPEPAEGAYIAEKKSRFGFSKRTRVNRAKSTGGKKTLNQQKADSLQRSNQPTPSIKTSIAPDQHARIQAAAAALQQKHMQEPTPSSPRRGRHDEDVKVKTNSVFTLQPVIMSEAVPAMKWANSYDKNAIRAKYLGDNFAGKGSSSNLGLSNDAPSVKVESSNHSTPMLTAPTQALIPPRNNSYGFPEKNASTRDVSRQDIEPDRSLPPPPHQQPDDLSTEPPTHVETPPVQSPAPLPAAPVIDVQTANQRTADAAEVPLPDPATPRTMQRKPLPPPKQSKEYVPSGRPDSFAPGPEYSEHPISAEEPTTIKPVVSPETSPDSKRTGGKKLKKVKGPGAFKSMFGRKKTEVPAPAAPQPNSTSAVAAARAALEARQKAVQSETPVAAAQTKASRRFSGINRKAPAGTNVVAPSMPQMAEEPTADLTPVPSPRFPTDHYQGSQASLSRVDTNEQRQAEHEFRTFDQGPLQDVPAFVPGESPVRSTGFSSSREHIPQEHPHPAKAHEIASRVFAAPLVSPSAEREVVDDDSDKSNELIQQFSPVQDRWAQIKKNAAERAAMQNSSRQSEEQSRKTDRTDDGETSGDETIESRVARIKARVAELTGNMDYSSSESTSRR
ncbi:hypothetical protein MMC30_000050 [Trapelia coarctata]|nr:hypothetical protein [Trapelia coarctata]